MPPVSIPHVQPVEPFLLAGIGLVETSSGHAIRRCCRRLVRWLNSRRQWGQVHRSILVGETEGESEVSVEQYRARRPTHRPYESCVCPPLLAHPAMALLPPWLSAPKSSTAKNTNTLLRKLWHCLVNRFPSGSFNGEGRPRWACLGARSAGYLASLPARTPPRPGLRWLHVPTIQAACHPCSASVDYFLVDLLQTAWPDSNPAPWARRPYCCLW